MAFKFVAVLCLATLAAAGDYEYNTPSNNNFVIRSNDNQQNANNNIQKNPPASINSYNNANNYRKDNTNEKKSVDKSSYAGSSGDYQSVKTPPVVAAQRNNLGFEYAPSEYYGPAKYEYSYDVNDPTTGDIKSHTESRDGNYVRGVYSLVDPDGYKRIVTYTADNVNGFKAIVRREPIAIKLTVPVVNFKSVSAVGAVADYTAQSSVKSQENTQNAAHEVRDSYASLPVHDGKGPYV